MRQYDTRLNFWPWYIGLWSSLLHFRKRSFSLVILLSLLFPFAVSATAPVTSLSRSLPTLHLPTRKHSIFLGAAVRCRAAFEQKRFLTVGSYESEDPGHTGQDMNTWGFPFLKQVVLQDSGDAT